MIYVFDIMEDFTDEQYRHLLPLLSVERRQKAEQFRSMRGRKLSAAAYLLLAHGLKKEYALQGPFDFQYNENGKPRLKNYPEIHFNMSHCIQGAACIISSVEAGLDMQGISPFDAALKRFVCSDDEFRVLEQSQNPDRDFCRLWVHKESVLKLRGTGITDDLKQVLCGQKMQNIQSFFFDSPPAAGFTADMQKPYIICCSFFCPPGKTIPCPALQYVPSFPGG
jgi:4'-phosphopantetheinyl transferase